MESPDTQLAWAHLDAHFYNALLVNEFIGVEKGQTPTV